MNLKKTRVFWTMDERDFVIERMAELIAKSVGSPRDQYLFKAAQDVMPEDRHRPWSSSLVQKERTLFAEARKRAQVVKARQIQEDVNPKPEPEPIVKIETEEVYVPVPTPLSLETVPTQEILAAAFLRIMEFLKPDPVKVQVSTAPQTERHVFQHHNPPSGPKIHEPRVPRVAVVGLLRDQFNHLKSRVNQKKVELVYIDKDQEGTNYPPSIDFVVVQRHSRHRYYNDARDKFGNDRVVFVDGGITQCAEVVGQRFTGALN